MESVWTLGDADDSFSHRVCHHGNRLEDGKKIFETGDSKESFTVFISKLPA